MGRTSEGYMWDGLHMIAVFINALTIVGFVLCLVILGLARGLWGRSHNPLLLLSFFYAGLGIAVFSLTFYFRQFPGGAFPSVLNGALIWGYAIIGLILLAISLMVNLWFPNWWRGRG